MTKLYGIIGQSPEIPFLTAMHQAAFKAEKIDGQFKVFDIDPVQEEALAHFCYETDLNDVSGFIVSEPYKERIMDDLDHYDPLTKKLGRTNLVENEASNLNGFNTEVTAIIQALQEKSKIPGKKVLILGAGELARTAVYGLKEFGAEIYVWNRTRKKAENVAEEFDIETIEFRDIEAAQFDIIINTTPIGGPETSDQSLLRSEQIKEGALVMDLIIIPKETQLLKEAMKAGAEVISGDRFLLHQAAGQFEIWFNKPAPFEAMERTLINSK